MITSTILNNLSAEELILLFDDLKKQLEDIKQNFVPKTPAEYLTRTEVAELLRCDLSTVHNWTKKGRLTAYGKGHRVYYKRSEIENDMVQLGKAKGRIENPKTS